jgi:hypothetical protein
MKSILLLINIFLYINLFSQVKITKDPRIDDLIKQAAPIVAPFKVPTIVGFRIQLAFDSDKAMIEDLRMKFMSAYPKIDTYLVFNAPNYFLKAGDFRTKLETERVMNTIRNQFPTAFLLKERIFLPRIDQ